MTTHPMLQESLDEASANIQIENDQKLHTEKANHEANISSACESTKVIWASVKNLDEPAF